MVRENRREEKQGRVVETGSRRREQGLSRHERGTPQAKACKGRPGRARRHRAETRGLLRAVRRDENVYERRHRRRGIGLRVFGDEVVIVKKYLNESVTLLRYGFLLPQGNLAFIIIGTIPFLIMN